MFPDMSLNQGDDCLEEVLMSKDNRGDIKHRSTKDRKGQDYAKKKKIMKPKKCNCKCNVLYCYLE